MNATETEALVALGLHAADLTKQIWDAVHSAHAGAIKADDALAHIGTLHQSLVDARAAQDKAAAEKFDTGGEG